MKNTKWILGGLAAYWLLSQKEENAIGAIVSSQCVGVTECEDGTWSTLPVGRRGVCSRHGGPKNGYRKRVQKKETSEIVDIIEVVDDNNEVVDVVEVPTQGVYFYTTYTTKKNKTLDVIAIEFGSIPPADTLATLRNSRFWYNRKDKTWYGKTNSENQNIIDSLPLVLNADIIEQTIPVVTETEVQQYVEKKSKETPSSKKYNFPIPPPKRGRLYSNDEYSYLQTLIKIQANEGYHSIYKNKKFPIVKQLISDLETFDQELQSQFGTLFYKLYGDRQSYRDNKNYNYKKSAANHHPFKKFEWTINHVLNKFQNKYKTYDNGFDEYKKRDAKKVQMFFENELGYAVQETYKAINELSNPMLYRKETDPQQIINILKESHNTALIGRILKNVHGIVIEFKTYSDTPRYKGYTINLHNVASGKIPLHIALNEIQKSNNQLEENKLETAKEVKETLAKIVEFNKGFLQKGYSFHLPTYTKKLRERFGSVSIENSDRTHKITIGPYKTRVVLVIGRFTKLEIVESIINSSFLAYECMNKEISYENIFSCFSSHYNKEKTLPPTKTKDLYNISGFYHQPKYLSL